MEEESFYRVRALLEDVVVEKWRTANEAERVRDGMWMSEVE